MLVSVDLESVCIHLDKDEMMNKMKKYMLEKIVAWLVGGSLFEDIKQVVVTLMNSEMPGERKREIALRRIKAMAADSATFMLNLAIEAAVVVLKQESNKS